MQATDNMGNGTAGQIDGKSIVVTGATGFIGGHFLQQLRGTGSRVTSVSDSTRRTSRHTALQDVNTVWFQQPSEIAGAIRAIKPDFVVHLHAAVTTARDAAALTQTVDTNLLPSLAIMEACKELGVERLIMMGSGEEFGLVTGRFDDTTNADPPSPYGASKAAVTCYAKMYANAFHLPVVVLRPSVVYGPRQAPRMLIPQVMEALYRGEPIDVTAGLQTRDFIHVDDIARGIVCALTAPGITGRSWNLGTGEIVTVKHCLKSIERISGRHGLIRYGALPYKQGEVFAYEPLVAETYAAFGWRPQIGLEAGLDSTWRAYAGRSASLLHGQEPM